MGLEEVRIGLIGRVRAVSEDSVVAGEGQAGLGALVGEVRMLVDKVVQNRHQIIVSRDDGAVGSLEGWTVVH